MIALDVPARDVTDVVQVLRALGSHRYVAGRTVLVHAAAIVAAEDGLAMLAPEQGSLLDEARAWAHATLAAPDVDPSSRDERLWRRCTEREAAAALEALWTSKAARARLERWLEEAGLPVSDALPFDEETEDDVHPVLFDAGWELLPLTELDPARHQGAIAAYGDPVLFASARFNEESAIPRPVYLQELPAIGPVEILRGVDAAGLLVEPLVLWADGDRVYHDYVLRGVLRAARIG
jgi:hypothetical protein